MIFNFKKHNTVFYNTLLHLSRNLFFYDKISLKDTYETRIYLMFLHFAIILTIFKLKKIKFPQNDYDSLFFNIENNLRELGFGDVSVNKKMKDLNKVFYDILLKFKGGNEQFTLEEKLISRYFPSLEDSNDEKYRLLSKYFENFYHFCFELSPETMIKDALKFKG